MAKSEEVANAVLDAILGSGNTLSAATLYLALYTIAPTEVGGGTECTGGSYARVAVTNNDDNWPAAVAAQKANALTIAFPEPTAPWGTVEAWGLHDHPTNDSLILWDLLDEAVEVDTGDPVQFAAGDLTFNET